MLAVGWPSPSVSGLSPGEEMSAGEAALDYLSQHSIISHPSHHQSLFTLFICPNHGKHRPLPYKLIIMKVIPSKPSKPAFAGLRLQTHFFEVSLLWSFLLLSLRLSSPSMIYFSALIDSFPVLPNCRTIFYPSCWLTFTLVLLLIYSLLS